MSAIDNNFSVVKKLLSEDPDLAFKAAHAFAAMNWGVHFDRTFGGGRTNSLGLMYFRLTPLCNLHCVMCGQRGDKGILKGDFAVEEAKKIVPLETYMKLVDEIKHKRPVVYLWGGEPFFYPDLFPLVRYMMDAGLLVSINTNGTTLAQNAERIVREKWHAVFVSLDGFEETNDKIRGEGSYRRVVEGFKEINRQKEKQGSHLPHMGIVTTVSNLNYRDLYRLAEAAQEFKLSWHIFNLGTYTNDAIVAKQRVFMKEKLDTDIKCLPAFATGHNDGIDGQEFYDVLTKIHEMQSDHPRITVPALEPDKINIYYHQLDTLVRTHCTVPWSQANIDYNGNVHFCADYPDYVIGNIKEQSFFDIFNGERAQKFRNTLKESPDGIFPGCVRCYQNMLCGRKVKGF